MEQIIFPLSNLDFYHPEEFINSISNQKVYDKIKGWKKSWGTLPYQFSLLIYGPKSSGKTYITKIWQNLSGATVLKNNHIFNGSIINHYQTFIIEDIENWLEEDVLHYFNLINERQKYLLITTSNLDINFKLKDLSSRIKSIMRLELKEPDDELMKILLFKIFSNNSIQVSRMIMDFLLVNLPRQFNQIIDSIERINQFALKTKRKITIKLIKQVLDINGVIGELDL